MGLFDNVLNESKLAQPIADKFDPVVQAVPNFLNYVEYFLGGMFGLYTIYFIFSLLKQRKEVKLLQEIKIELQEIKALKEEIHASVKKKK